MDKNVVPSPKVQDPIYDDAFVTIVRNIRAKLNKNGMSDALRPQNLDRDDNDQSDGYSKTTNSPRNDRGTRARSTIGRADTTSHLETAQPAGNRSL